MSNDSDWIHDLIPKKQVDAMNLFGDNLIENMANGVSLVISASNQSAIELCKAWERTKQGEEQGFEAIAYFINGLIQTLETHLDEEHINPYEE